MSDKVSLSSEAVTAAKQPQPGEVGYVVPFDNVSLPSEGKIYPVDSVLHMMDTIELKSMTTEEEDILTSRSLLKQGKAFSALMKSCICNKAIDTEEMVTGDRNAILVSIRISGYGSNYDTTVDCPYCEERTKYMFELNKLELKRLGADPVELGKNLFYMKLPRTGKEVYFKLLTAKDEAELSITVDKARKVAGVGGVDKAVSLRLLYSVTSIDGESDKNKLAKVIKSLPASDSRALRTYIDKVSPGIKMEQTFVCPKCEKESEVTVPMGPEFFWPTS